jgi:hypothetical protein
MHWSATPSLSSGEVDMVQFFIDGSRWWDDSEPPYTFGPPGAYVPATWLSSLRKRSTFLRSRTHEFMVRFKTRSGEIWTGPNVRLRTPRADLPRRIRAGGYLPLSRKDLANPPPPGSYPTADGYLTFYGAALLLRGGRDEAGWQVSVDDEYLRLGTPIFYRQRAYAAPGSGFIQLKEVLCRADGPPATYAWSQSRGRPISIFQGETEYAHNLGLRAVKEPCQARRQLLEGVWETSPLG